MGKQKQNAVIIRQERLHHDVCSMWLLAGEIAKEAKPGQFISVYSKDGSRLLPRPISICEIKKETGALRIVYRLAGAGTTELSKYHAEDTVEILGPLGNGFPLEETTGKKVLLLGGGIGIPPLLELAKQLPKTTKILLGYRDSVLFLKEEFEALGEVLIATDDGSEGQKGTVLDILKKACPEVDVIFSCGPTPMLKALQSFAKEKQIPAWVSVEERMACGIGACLACVCKTKEVDAYSKVKNRRVCQDGSVFLASELDLEGV